MELKLLRAFLTVTELHHFGRAAEALNVTQPALSKQVAALEDTLGARLFERGRHGAELTSFGAEFLAAHKRWYAMRTNLSHGHAKPAVESVDICASVSGSRP